MVSIDDLISGFEAYPELNIRHDDNDILTSTNLAPFLIKFFTEISEGNTFYDGLLTFSKYRLTKEDYFNSENN